MMIIRKYYVVIMRFYFLYIFSLSLVQKGKGDVNRHFSSTSITAMSNGEKFAVAIKFYLLLYISNKNASVFIMCNYFKQLII